MNVKANTGGCMTIRVKEDSQKNQLKKSRINFITMLKDELYNHDYINIDGNQIHKTAIIGENVRLGKGNVIMPYAVLGEQGFIRGAQSKRGKVIIGNNNTIGCHTTVMAGEKGITQIGDDNMVMNYANIGHNVKIGNNNEIGAKSIVCGFTQIGSGNKIKTGVTIRNRLKIGNDNLIGMRSNVVMDISTGMLVYGNPAKCQRNIETIDNHHDGSE